ncbi:MAG: hypothetical protein KGL19_14330 [Bacteroidota bacterium]|nr:hypothetical protein [Bacteroidota bacterium]
MGKRKINILEQAAIAIAEISFFVESKGMPVTAKKFVDEVFEFFETLSVDTFSHKRCEYKRWKDLGYRCVHYKKKYIVAYLDLKK